VKYENSYFVSNDGDNYKGDGSRLKPWKNISVAVLKVEDGSSIIVKPGIYQGAIKIRRKFEKGILVKSEFPYQAKITNNQRVIAFIGNASNIIFEGFDIFHTNNNTKPLVVHIDGGGSKNVNNITLKNNIIHDSYNNDLLKINNGAKDIKVFCNMFYNQGDSDEHIDINSASNVQIQSNIFFNDFNGSNREITNKSSSYIVIKDSNGSDDWLIGANNIQVNGNIFFNWQGSPGYGFVLVGEDGKSYFEATNIKIFNNLMLGNSKISMRSPFGVKGAKDIWFYNNTITGDLPSNAFAMRVNNEGENKTSTNLFFYNNIWSDPLGTMGIGSSEKSIDFSDTYLHQLNTFVMESNIIWNGGESLPYSFFDAINPNDDNNLTVIDPTFPDNRHLVPPIWNAKRNEFNDGSFSISETFNRLVYFYGSPKFPSNIQKSLNSEYIPLYNILGQRRKQPHTAGAL